MRRVTVNSDDTTERRAAIQSVDKTVVTATDWWEMNYFSNQT